MDFYRLAIDLINLALAIAAWGWAWLIIVGIAGLPSPELVAIAALFGFAAGIGANVRHNYTGGK